MDTKNVQTSPESLDDRARRLAHELWASLQAACSELGYENSKKPWDDGTEAKIRRAKRMGVTDISDWLADGYYNDPSVCEDILGDKLHDLTHDDAAMRFGDGVLRKAIIEQLKIGAHPALLEACENLAK